MGDANRVALPVWVVLVLTSFAASVDLGVASVVGLLGQWFLKAPKGIPTWLGQGAIFGVVAAGYCSLHPQWPLDQPYIVKMACWGLAALGVSSVSAGTGGAPTTNSK